MNHKLGLEAAVAYGRLFKFVINVEQNKFTQAFEEFLDAYDADNAEKYPKTISKVWYPTANEQRDIPKVGEIYRDKNGARFKIYALAGEVLAIELLSADKKNLFPIIFLTLKMFNEYHCTKEDKSWHA